MTLLGLVWHWYAKPEPNKEHTRNHIIFITVCADITALVIRIKCKQEDQWAYNTHLSNTSINIKDISWKVRNAFSFSFYAALLKKKLLKGRNPLSKEEVTQRKEPFWTYLTPPLYHSWVDPIEKQQHVKVTMSTSILPIFIKIPAVV